MREFHTSSVALPRVSSMSPSSRSGVLAVLTAMAAVDVATAFLVQGPVSAGSIPARPLSLRTAKSESFFATRKSPNADRGIHTSFHSFHATSMRSKTSNLMMAESGQNEGEQMKFASGLSVGFDSVVGGLDDAIERCQKQFEGAPSVDLATVFISARYMEARGGSKPATNQDIQDVVKRLQDKLGAKHVIGCIGGGVCGTGEEDGLPEEFENFKAIALSVAYLPGVEIKPFRIKTADLPNEDALQEEWREIVGDVKPEDEPAIIMFSDPGFSRHGDLISLLQGLDYAYSGCPKVGGISAPSPVAAVDIPTVFGSMAGEHSDGTVVGVSLTGNVEVEPIVAQGCSPIGPLLEVAQARGNVVKEVTEVEGGSRTMMTVEALKKAIETLSPQQAQLAQTALFVGIANDDFKSEPEQGDFLIRQVVGVQVSDGSLVVGDSLRPGQRIRFHIRDREAAVQEIETLMAQYKRARLTEMMSGAPKPPAAGLMMFACVGRGRGLFGEANYDSRMAYYSTGVPVAGIFCNGEVGPVSGKSFLHGFSSVFAIFRPRSPKKVEEAKEETGEKGGE